MHCKRGDIQLGPEERRNSLRKKDIPQKKIQTDENNKIFSRKSKLRATKKWISIKRKKFGFYAKWYDRTLGSSQLAEIKGN